MSQRSIVFSETIRFPLQQNNYYNMRKINSMSNKKSKLPSSVNPENSSTDSGETDTPSTDTESNDQSSEVDVDDPVAVSDDVPGGNDPESKLHSLITPPEGRESAVEIGKQSRMYSTPTIIFVVDRIIATDGLRFVEPAGLGLVLHWTDGTKTNIVTPAAEGMETSLEMLGQVAAALGFNLFSSEA